MRFFSFCYNNFIFNDIYGSSLFNRKDDFRDNDSTIIGFVKNLSATATERVLDLSKKEDLIDYLSIIIGEYDEKFSNAQSSDIRSAGFMRSLGRTATPIVASAAIGLFSYLGSIDTLNEFEESIKDLRVVNSAAPEDPSCNPKVHAASAEIFRSIPAEDLWKMCKRFHVTHQRTGLVSGSKVYREERSVSDQSKNQQ